jgi:flagellar biosynthesis/type III secretory pathway M-ring protein FliF/YscJ
MKYTGITGRYLPDMFWWWLDGLFLAKNFRIEDISLYLLFNLLGAVLAGFVLQKLLSLIKTKKEKYAEKEQTESMDEKTKGTDEKTESADEQTERTDKTIHYIENPLPLPKKHVKRSMDFGLEEKEDDFDIEIKPGDDFDI